MIMFKRYIYEMRFHVLVSQCMKETKWHNIGMLMNMWAIALKNAGLYK